MTGDLAAWRAAEARRARDRQVRRERADRLERCLAAWRDAEVRAGAEPEPTDRPL